MKFKHLFLFIILSVSNTLFAQTNLEIDIVASKKGKRHIKKEIKDTIKILKESCNINIKIGIQVERNLKYEGTMMYSLVSDKESLFNSINDDILDNRFINNRSNKPLILFTYQNDGSSSWGLPTGKSMPNSLFEKLSLSGETGEQFRNSIIINIKNAKKRPYTMAHEIGHLLGLEHPEYEDTKDIMDHSRKRNSTFSKKQCLVMKRNIFDNSVRNIQVESINNKGRYIHKNNNTGNDVINDFSDGSSVNQE